jgi:hypothetical protein
MKDMKTMKTALENPKALHVLHGFMVNTSESP